MKLAEQELVVRTSGIESKKFGIKLSRKMFRILSADLYSDKIKAVIRELSTNAADAHVAAGKATTPFEVHLPSIMEPWFSVRDYGTGLSQEQMESVYTQYGESTKTDSNEQTGCLGLGSKSPFAYTDSFTVESRYNGKLYIYSAYMSEDGSPALSEPLTISDTKDSNGLMIKFSVKTGDFHSFIERAVNVLRWFKVRPVVTGNHTFKYPLDTEYMIDTDKYSIPKSYTGQSYCLMGNVCYPLEAWRFNDSGYNSKVVALLTYGVVVKVNIGDVDITASRESLSYDNEEGSVNKTIPNIKKALIEAVNDMEVLVTKEVSNAPTLWEASKQLRKVRSSFPNFSFASKWNGQDVKIEYKTPIGTESWRDRGSYSKTRIRQVGVYSIPADDTPIIVADGKNVKATIRYYMEQNSISFVYVLLADFDIKWAIDLGIGDKLICASTLPKPPRAVGVRTSKEKTTFYKLKGTTHTNAGDNWESVEIDNEDTEDMVYVEIRHFKAYNGDSLPATEPQELGNICDRYKKITGKELTLYGVRPSDTAKLAKTAANWIKLKDFITETLEVYLPQLEKEIEAEQELEKLNHCSIIAKYSTLITLPNNSTLNQYMEKVTSYKEIVKRSNVKTFQRLCEYCGVAYPNTVTYENSDLVQRQKEVWTLYPLLAYLNAPYDSDTQKKFYKYVEEYVKQVDSLVEEKNEVVG